MLMYKQSYGDFVFGIDFSLLGVFIFGSGVVLGIIYNSLNLLMVFDILIGFVKDKIKVVCFDVEWMVGNYMVCVGIDKVKLSLLNVGQVEVGGGIWSYCQMGDVMVLLMFGFYIGVIIDDGVVNFLVFKGYYVCKYVFSDVMNVIFDQDVEYIEDKWQVNKKFFVQMGLCNEGFFGVNGEGVIYLKFKNFISLCLVSIYDIFGDGSFMFKGSIGCYSIQMLIYFVVCGVGILMLIYQYFCYMGVDVNGQFIGMMVLMVKLFLFDGEIGQFKDVNIYVVWDFKFSYQDEV